MQIAEHRARYAAFKSRDARFDGRFFVGVSSTGIYCRPVCTAKLPKEENCTFYDSAAAAESAGFRPCLMCRPELAPGAAPIDARFILARKAAVLLEASCGNGLNIAECAQRLGCSGRHLRRAFMAEYNVTPVHYLQTCKLLLAKNLLTDTALSVTEVAMAAGFGSLRRFNDLFKERYRMPPTALRKQISVTNERADTLTLMLGYRPPYQWEHMLGFLRARAIPGVEVVTENTYARTVRYLTVDERDMCGWLRVGHKPEKNALSITFSSNLLPALAHMLARVRDLFDLCCCPDAVHNTLSAMDDVSPGMFTAGVRLPGCFEPFEMAVLAVLGHRLSVKAAGTLAGRMANAFGSPVKAGMAGLTHSFPRAHDIAAMQGDIADHLGPLGITRAHADMILNLARKIVSKEIDFSLCAQPEAEIRKLMTIPGIGAWTAQYIAMRAMGWPDAFPHTDPGIKQVLALNNEEVLQKAEAWRPWRSYATITLWNFLHSRSDA